MGSIALLVLLRQLCSANNVPVLYSLGIKDIFTTDSIFHSIRSTVVISPKASNLEWLCHGLNNGDL